MHSFQRGGRGRFVLALLLLTAVTLITLDARGFGPVVTARNAAFSVLTPLRELADRGVDPFVRAWRGIFDYAALEEENALLRARLAELEGEDLREVSARETLERFLAQAEVTFAAEVPQVVARVVAGPATSFEDTVTIDKGSNHGIRVGMAVVTGAGMVGRIDRVTPDRAVVQLMTDPRVQVGARLVGTQVRGIVRGQGSGRSLLLELPDDATVSEGEIIETSGLDRSLYPPDVPIGRVVGIADRAASEASEGSPVAGLDPISTQEVEIELVARLDRLNFLTVLLWEPSG